MLLADLSLGQRDDRHAGDIGLVARQTRPRPQAPLTSNAVSRHSQDELSGLLDTCDDSRRSWFDLPLVSGAVFSRSNQDTRADPRPKCSGNIALDVIPYHGDIVRVAAHAFHRCGEEISRRLAEQNGFGAGGIFERLDEGARVQAQKAVVILEGAIAGQCQEWRTLLQLAEGCVQAVIGEGLCRITDDDGARARGAALGEILFKVRMN